MGEGRKDEGYRGGRDQWSKKVMEGKRERKKKEKEKKNPEACKRLPGQLFQLQLPPARPGRCNNPPSIFLALPVPHNTTSTDSSPPPCSRSPACKGVAGRSWGEGEACEFLTLFL